MPVQTIELSEGELAFIRLKCVVNAALSDFRAGKAQDPKPPALAWRDVYEVPSC